MEKASKALRRSGVRIRSIGSGYSDLQMVISQLKDVRTASKVDWTFQSPFFSHLNWTVVARRSRRPSPRRCRTWWNGASRTRTGPYRTLLLRSVRLREAPVLQSYNRSTTSCRPFWQALMTFQTSFLMIFSLASTERCIKESVDILVETNKSEEKNWQIYQWNLTGTYSQSRQWPSNLEVTDWAAAGKEDIFFSWLSLRKTQNLLVILHIYIFLLNNRLIRALFGRKCIEIIIELGCFSYTSVEPLDDKYF